MIPVVIDTNIWISYALTNRGHIQTIVQGVLEGIPVLSPKNFVEKVLQL